MLLEVAILLLCTEQLFTVINLFGCITFSRGSYRCVVNPAKLGNLFALNATEKILCDFFFFILGYLHIFENLLLGWNFDTVVKYYYSL